MQSSIWYHSQPKQSHYWTSHRRATILAKLDGARNRGILHVDAARRGAPALPRLLLLGNGGLELDKDLQLLTE
ncbi:hypothetical protein BS78_04G008100 [Paspalum vaginatum]|nr:hypothetical protein BS78_04G008100 [Paspalum vaginatum]